MLDEEAQAKLDEVWERMCDNLEQLSDSALLLFLDQVRNTISFENKYGLLIEALCTELVARGVYPEAAEFGNSRHSALKMVEYYGAYWHQFAEPHFCPKCKADLRDWNSGPPFKREIYCKDGRGDTLFDPFLQCPDCRTNISEEMK